MGEQARIFRALKQIAPQLVVAHAGIVVAAAALRHQRAEQDEEIASVLSYCVGPRLLEQIQRIDELVSQLESGARSARHPRPARALWERLIRLRGR